MPTLKTGWFMERHNDKKEESNNLKLNLVIRESTFYLIDILIQYHRDFFVDLSLLFCRHNISAIFFLKFIVVNKIFHIQFFILKYCVN